MHLLLLTVPNDSAIQYSVVSVTDAQLHPSGWGLQCLSEKTSEDPVIDSRATCPFHASSPASTVKASRSKIADYFSLVLPPTTPPAPPPRLRLGTACTTLPGKAGEDRQPPPCIRSHTADTDLRALLATTPFPPSRTLLKGPCSLGSCQHPHSPPPKEGLSFGPEQVFSSCSYSARRGGKSQPLVTGLGLWPELWLLLGPG